MPTHSDHKQGSRTRRRECNKIGLSFTTYATGFKPPGSLHMIMHWVRALVHAYCLSFQQLERIIVHESDVFQDDLVLEGTDWAIMAERMSAKTTSSIWECVQHMEVAWYMLGVCMDTPQWREHAMQPFHKDVTTDVRPHRCCTFLSPSCFVDDDDDDVIPVGKAGPRMVLRDAGDHGRALPRVQP